MATLLGLNSRVWGLRAIHRGQTGCLTRMDSCQIVCANMLLNTVQLCWIDCPILNDIVQESPRLRTVCQLHLGEPTLTKASRELTKTSHAVRAKVRAGSEQIEGSQV